VHAESDLVATVVKVVCDSVDRGEHLGIAQRNGALGLRLAVVPLVNGETAAHGREHRPTVSVRMLRVFRADRPEQHPCIEIRGLRRRDGDLKLTVKDLRGDSEIDRNATVLEILRRQKLPERGARLLRETLAPHSAPRVLGELIYEPAQMVPVSNRYLESISHRWQAAEPSSESMAPLIVARTQGWTAGGDTWQPLIATNI
jgi:hypothetical protein